MYIPVCMTYTLTSHSLCWQSELMFCRLLLYWLHSTAALWPGNPVPCREDLAKAAQKYFNQTGWAAEVGVLQGIFSRDNLAHWRGRYFMVDIWTFRPEDETRDKNWEEQWIHEQNYILAKAHVRFARGRGWPIRGLSWEVARRFADGALDWVYLDAMHTYNDTLRDLEAWYPKVRRGGLVSGDDFGDSRDTEWLSTERFERGLRRGRRVTSPTDFAWGTVRAVTAFARKHRHQLFVTYLQDCYTFPAWYFVKS